VLSPRNAERAQALADRHPTVTVAADNQAVIDAADVVVLAVRPQDRAVLDELRFHERPVVSLLAGVTHAELAPLVAPAQEIRRAIPLPDVARRTGVTPIHPAGGAARELFARLGQVIEVEDIAVYDAMAAATATMAAHFRYVAAISDWLAAQGVPADEAESYVAATFAGLGATLAGAGKLDGLAEAHATPGGLNEQFATLLDQAGTFALVGRSLDAVLARIRG
jgi:pyrroline-5-carboxylate reductase